MRDFERGEFAITDLSPEEQQQFMEEYVWPRVDAMLPGEYTPPVVTAQPIEGTWGDVIDAANKREQEVQSEH